MCDAQFVFQLANDVSSGEKTIWQLWNMLPEETRADYCRAVKAELLERKRANEQEHSFRGFSKCAWIIEDSFHMRIEEYERAIHPLERTSDGDVIIYRDSIAE